jgi:hypothetical protein
MDEEWPQHPRLTVEAAADVRSLSLAPRQFFTTCGGLFLFLPHLARLPVETLAQAARLPGSKMIPPAHALRACLALKLWSLERKSHVMSLVADEGLALFSGLNVSPSPNAPFHSRLWKFTSEPESLYARQSCFMPARQPSMKPASCAAPRIVWGKGQPEISLTLCVRTGPPP